jgi:hypothetical protein
MRRARRADGHADREPAQSIFGRCSISSIRGCSAAQGSFRTTSSACGTRWAAGLLRPAARSRAPVHICAGSRPTRVRHRRFAGEVGSQAYCPLARRQAALVPGVRRRTRQTRSRRLTGIAATRYCARVSDAVQADLQSPVAVAGRRRVGREPTAGSSRACARSPRCRCQAGEGAGVHPVSRSDRTACRVSRQRDRTPRAHPARRNAGARTSRSS